MQGREMGSAAGWGEVAGKAHSHPPPKALLQGKEDVRRHLERSLFLSMVS